MGRYFYLLIPLFLFGCSDSSNHTDSNPPTDSNTSSEEAIITLPETIEDHGNAFEHVKQMQRFLYEDQSVSIFEGEGNEFADYRVETN